MKGGLRCPGGEAGARRDHTDLQNIFLSELFGGGDGAVTDAANP